MKTLLKWLMFWLSSGLTAAAYAADQKIENFTLTGTRGMRFCEFLLIFEDRVEIYNTSASPGCPPEQWDALDPAQIAANQGAQKAQLNGPKYWAMDEQVLGFGESKNFGGIEARYAATLPLAALGSGEGADPYAPYVTKKAQRMIYKAGRPVYELVDAEGNAYVMNAYGSKVPDGDPAKLEAVMPIAEGWQFRVRSPEDDLVIDQKGDVASHMVGDGFHQYYSLEVVK